MIRNAIAVSVLVLALPASAQWNTAGDDIFAGTSSNATEKRVGIGTTLPAATLHLAGSRLPLMLLDSPTEARIMINVAGNPAFLINHDGTQGVIGTQWGGGPLRLKANNQIRMTIDSNGNVGIGTSTPTKKLDVVGDAHFTGTVTGGNIRAHYQDLAEWVPATSDLQPGTVVVIDGSGNNRVSASFAAYDTSVAGVVSEQPGVLLGEEGTGKEAIATTGRVRVRVDATSAPIRLGDLLVTGSKPGTAMRSEPMELNGRRFHQPGTIIGKALEPLESGVGTILVLLSMQ